MADQVGGGVDDTSIDRSARRLERRAETDVELMARWIRIWFRLPARWLKSPRYQFILPARKGGDQHSTANAQHPTFNPHHPLSRALSLTGSAISAHSVVCLFR